MQIPSQGQEAPGNVTSTLFWKLEKTGEMGGGDGGKWDFLVDTQKQLQLQWVGIGW